MTTETSPPTLQQAAQAVLDRWNSPKWEWLKQGPTGELMADLRAALALPVEPVSDHFPFYELKFIMRVLAHKGTAPREDWETARGMALAVFNDWHKITGSGMDKVEPTAQPVGTLQYVHEGGHVGYAIEMIDESTPDGTALFASTPSPVPGDPDGAKVARLMGLLDTLPDTTNLANRAVFKAALHQEFGSAALPVEPATDKLLQIIAATYQIAGVYDAPEHVLDVLANPELATQEQIDALLPFNVPLPVEPAPESKA